MGLGSKKIVHYIPNQARPGTRDLRPELIGRGPQKKETISGQKQRKETSSRSRPKKKIKKISDQLGPSGPRTKRSVDLCLERLFGDGPVKARIDSNLKTLH